MEKKLLIEKLKKWDFKQNSKKMFAEKYNISVKTVDRYIEKYDIPYDKRVCGVAKNRDKHGKFIYDQNLPKCSFESNNQPSKQDSYESITKNKNKPIRSLKEYCEKYDKYFTS